METYGRFLFEFLEQFFSGFKEMFTGIWNGALKTFNITKYREIIDFYKNDFKMSEWLLTGTAIATLGVILGITITIIVIILKKHTNLIKKIEAQEEMLEKITEEKEQLVVEKARLNTNRVLNNDETEENEKILDENLESRFSKLTEVDKKYENYKVVDYKNNFTLEEFCEMFRNFAASKLKLYYKPKMVKLFVAGLASTKLVILQGISGTGKTSLAYAWGKFVKHDSCVASVQPSWRDRTDIFGYLNEFTKRFNETDFLKYLYEAGYQDEVFTVILDEMNLARVEYYFAEMLSILEMHNTDEWQIEIVNSSLSTDPKKLISGKLKIPENTWYIGTINNDDSTFMVTDKVYDRAMPIDINEKGEYFKAKPTEAMDINFSYLKKIFDEAMKKYAMSDEIIAKIEEMDDYVIKHFRVAFGNRIVKHMKKFVPVYVGCGGDELEAVDYFLAKKVLRKFEALNLALIRDEIDGYINFLNNTFGKDKMSECIEFLLRLKKMS